MQKILAEYFRCPDASGGFTVGGRLPQQAEFFSFGSGIMCYGRVCQGGHSNSSNSHVRDVLTDVHVNESVIELPFDPSEVIDNLRYERYVFVDGKGHGRRMQSPIRSAYYLARPLLPVGLRKHLQRAHFSGWQRLSFPKWPVDSTVDSVLERLLAIAIRSAGMKPIPFIWFWPKGAIAAAIMTHDVETEKGVQRSSYMMDVNESFGIPASFQIVPEQRYVVRDYYLSEIRRRGFEVNVQDLNHDGHLFRDFTEFKRRVVKVNQYGREFGALGFRSAVLYRNQEWYDLLKFEYDMSVPNVAHLDPQRGGCCTVMPYFVGDLVELPVTTTQDYTLFHILNDYSLHLWEEQIGLILQKHGLLNLIIHPDYITGPREEKTYRGLLAILARLRREQNVWVALPREVSSWWRQRSRMTIVERNGDWRVEGPGSERAQVAFATIEDGELTYNFPSTPVSAKIQF